MLPYWLMYLFPALGALAGLGQHHGGKRRDQAFLLLLFVIFAVVMGLRDETGGDFFNYRATVDLISYQSVATSMSGSDPAFTIVAIISNWLGWGIYGVNLTCAVLLLYGLLRFVRTLPDPWLAITVAVPYMIIVIGMGYIRQGVAIGFILLAFIDLNRRAWGWLVVHMGLAVTFHVTAVCMLPIMAVAVLRRQPAVLVGLAILAGLAYWFILRERFAGLYSGYVAAKYDSSGAQVRLMMNALPAVIFLAFRKRFPIEEPARTAWVLIAASTLGLSVLLQFSPSSTWIDRLGLFFSPIQLVVFGYVGMAFANHAREQRVAVFGGILFYGIVLYVWLNYAEYAFAWIPYRWVLSSGDL
jgi:nitrate reductase NapE component